MIMIIYRNGEQIAAACIREQTAAANDVHNPFIYYVYTCVIIYSIIW